MLFCIAKDALLNGKRCPLREQKMPFCIAKGHLLEAKRACIVFPTTIYLYKKPL